MTGGVWSYGGQDVVIWSLNGAAVNRAATDTTSPVLQYVLHPRCCKSSAPSPLHASTLVLAMRVRIMRNHADIKRIHAYTLCQYYLELTLNFLEVQTNTLITFKIFQPWILKRGHNIGNLTFHSTQNVKL